MKHHVNCQLNPPISTSTLFAPLSTVVFPASISSGRSEVAARGNSGQRVPRLYLPSENKTLKITCNWPHVHLVWPLTRLSRLFSHVETGKKAFFSQTTQTPLLRSRPLLARIIFCQHTTRPLSAATDPEIDINTNTDTGRSTTSGYLLFAVHLGSGAFAYRFTASSGHRPYGRLVHDGGQWGRFHESYQSCQLSSRPCPRKQQWYQAQEK